MLQVQPFIKWLEEAEEESESDDWWLHCRINFFSFCHHGHSPTQDRHNVNAVLASPLGFQLLLCSLISWWRLAETRPHALMLHHSASWSAAAWASIIDCRVVKPNPGHLGIKQQHCSWSHDWNTDGLRKKLYIVLALACTSRMFHNNFYWMVNWVVWQQGQTKCAWSIIGTHFVKNEYALQSLWKTVTWNIIVKTMENVHFNDVRFLLLWNNCLDRNYLDCTLKNINSLWTLFAFINMYIRLWSHY